MTEPEFHPEKVKDIFNILSGSTAIEVCLTLQYIASISLSKVPDKNLREHLIESFNYNLIEDEENEYKNISAHFNEVFGNINLIQAINKNKELH